MGFLSNIKSLLDDWNKLKVGDVTKEELIESNPQYSEYNPSAFEQVVSGVEDFGDRIGSVVENWVNKNTGNAHLTPEYQHEEHLANTAYQRAAADMTAAGLSKYGGVSTASSPSPSPGSGLLATALAVQNLKSEKLAFDQSRYNFAKAKEWGVPTSAVDQFAKYDALSKVLFGKPLTDYIDEGGLISALQKLFGGQPDPLSSPISDPEPSSFTEGAYSDLAQSAINTVTRLDPKKVHTMPVYLKLSDFAHDGLGSATGISVTESGAPNLNQPQFEMDNSIIKMYRNSLYDQLGTIARGQPQGLDLSSLATKYASELAKEGIFDKSTCVSMVRSWLEKDMYELGYSFDGHDKLWYYDHW